MDKLENKQGIKLIIMKPIAFTKCVIGDDWYKNKIKITFYPDSTYPDYIQVSEWIMNNIDGKSLNIEEVVDMIYKMIETEYAPKALEVTNEITGCKTHFDVTVIK